jgi:uncharacterized membrane-anchored protein YhcB (DUF1043 family)
LPLFAVILLMLIVGVLVGGFAAWLRQGKHRSNSRRFEGEVRALHAEMDAIRRRFGTSNKPPAPAEPSPLVIPPPIP